MAAERAQTTDSADTVGRLTTAELFDRLSRFDGPPEQFLVNLLALQCLVASAEAGAILRLRTEGQVDALAAYPPLPPGSIAPPWLAEAVEAAGGVIKGGRTTVKPVLEPDHLYGTPATWHLVMIPLRGGGGVLGVAAFLARCGDPPALGAIAERLELTASLLSLYEMRLTVQRHRFDLNRLRLAMETLAAVNEPERFASSAMSMCNEVAARWQCERVSLGFLEGRYVRLRAMSHTEKFSRKMRLIQDTEAAMEECLDQDLEVIHPPTPQAVYVSRAAGELSTRHGPTAICSLPLRRGGQVVGVLTAERPADQPFTREQIESLRLTCDLCVPRLNNLYLQDRWIGAKAAAGVRKGLALAVGPKHTWIKAVVIAVCALGAYIVLAKGAYQVEAPFTLEATRRQVVPAPFDGFLKTVSVKPAARIEAGKTVLAALDASELRLQLGQAQAEQARYLKQAGVALRDDNPGDAEIAQAEADRIAWVIRPLEYKISRAEILSPLSGVVVAGDLERHIGAPVKTGEVLFEIAPLDSLRAELRVPEDRMADVIAAFERAEKSGQEVRGQLATASVPQERIDFVLERINPVAEVVNQQNVFKVRVRLAQIHTWMAPGMEGVAKIDIDRRSYAWLWTHRLVNWLRMKLWI